MTLTEILFAVTISGMVMAGVMAIFIQALKTYDYDSKKLEINRQIRDFTAELTQNATLSNYALVFPDFFTRVQAATVTNPVTGVTITAGTPLQVEDGQSGDMMVLVFLDPANDTRISRIVGYYRAPLNPNDALSRGPVRKFELTFNPSTTTRAVDLIPAITTYQTWPKVIELSEGLSDGRLFHNFYGRSVMVNGEIIQDNGRGARMATNTYNFTVSPRG